MCGADDAADYLISTTEIEDRWYNVVVVGVIMLVLMIRMFRFDEVLVRFSTVLTLLAIIPAFLFIGFALPYANPSDWIATRGDTNCTTVNDVRDCDSIPVQWVCGVRFRCELTRAGVSAAVCNVAVERVLCSGHTGRRSQ